MSSGTLGADRIASWIDDARRRTTELVQDLSDEQLRVPMLEILNPFLWEIGHLAWFQERWVLRHLNGDAPLQATADELYDSMAVAHDTRWDLRLPSRAETLDYMSAVRDRVVSTFAGKIDDRTLYFSLLAIFHEDMHGEAFTCTRHTLGYPVPPLSDVRLDRGRSAPGAPVVGDVEVPGGTLMFGACRGDGPFVFDNEQWAHPVDLEPFAISKVAVTQAEFADFVEDGGYARREHWSDAGWSWRESEHAEHPTYWVGGSGGAWRRKHFDLELPLEPHRPVIHVSWYEADAYCRWARRRLPTEPEWEAAASCESAQGRLSSKRRRYPWGDRQPDPTLANLDSTHLDTVDVGAFPDGDSALGCRQMLGNVWEWTSSVFEPYPGFQPGPYEEYSAPWFGTRRVLRGGAWATRSRLITNTYRNYFTPDRRDVFAGFRTCALR